jgi:hypothetical protein
MSVRVGENRYSAFLCVKIATVDAYKNKNLFYLQNRCFSL